MRASFLALLIGLLFSSLALAAAGSINVQSVHDVKTTADRLESVLLSKGMKVFLRVDHAAGAESVDLALRPTELVVFGNPKVGTPLMQCQQSIAIDLPQKALIWQAEGGQVWLTYNDPSYLATRHELDSCAANIVQKVTAALAKFAQAATQP